MAYLHGLDGDQDAKNVVLRSLAIEAQAEGNGAEVAQVILILALWPGLDAAHGRLLRFFRHDPDRLAAELVGRLSAGIARQDLSRVTRIAATLLRNVERDIRRMLKTEFNRAEDELHDDLLDPEAPAWCQHNGNIEPSIERLTAQLRDLIGDDAVLVIAVTVLGLSQREAALTLGMTHDVARKRFQRAMARLEQVFQKNG